MTAQYELGNLAVPEDAKVTARHRQMARSHLR